jgi:CBS domain-containing protein
MALSVKVKAVRRPQLDADNAADLMTPNPVSIRDSASVREAVALLIDKGFSAAPVIDSSGRPVGVLSRADIMVHDREKVDYVASAPEYYEKSDLMLRSGENLKEGFQIESPDQTRVRDIMTPVVFSVSPETAAAKVIQDMVGLKVHRLFVVDDGGVLVGVISALDVMRHLTS